MVIHSWSSINRISITEGFVNKIYLLSKDSYEAKYQFLINKREKVDLKHCNDSKTFTECSNDIQDVYKNIEQYNPGKNA